MAYVTFDAVQITADNTNVFSGRLGAQVPNYFKPRHVRIQVVASDSDWLISLSVGGDEVARNAAPSRTQADNVQQFDWQSPHWVCPVPAGVTDFEILLDVNVVTAGVGVALIQWE